MASGGHSNRASGIAQSGERPDGNRVMITVDEEGLVSLLARHEQLQRMTEDHLAGSLREQERLLWLNAQLEEQVATLRERVTVLSLELSLRCGEGLAAPNGGRRSP